MALRHAEEPERRLTPEEARAFLQVHAEREAADAPTVDDMAETLGLAPDEARAILAEARARAVVAPAVQTRPHNARLGLLLALAIGLIVLGLQVGVANSPPTQVAAPMPAAVPTPPAAVTPEIASLDYFGLDAWADGAHMGQTANSATFGQPFPRLSASDAQTLRTALVGRLVDQLDLQDEADPRWRTAERLTVGITGPDARMITVEVPLPPGTLPLTHDPDRRQRLSATLAPLLEAAWPQIFHPAPNG